MNANQRADQHRQFFEQLKAAKPLIGAWLFLGDLGAAEVLSQQSFDFLIIDMEHSPVEFDTIRQLLAMTEGCCPMLVRVRANTRANVTCALDLGAAGVIVPMIQSVADVERLVEYGKYHPLGKRGVGPMRASGYGARMQAHLHSANVEQLLIPQMENPEVLQQIDEILDVPGYDALFIGPADLAHGMGLLGKPSDDRVRELMQRSITRIRERGVAVGSAFPSPEEAVGWVHRGVSFVTVGCDFRFLTAAARESLQLTRELLKSNEPHTTPPSPKFRGSPAQTIHDTLIGHDVAKQTQHNLNIGPRSPHN